MHAGIIFLLVIVGSILFHIFTPWYWTDIASNWGGMDSTITLTFWVGGGVFVAVCLFMVYCIFRYSHKEDRRAEYKPEDKKIRKNFNMGNNPWSVCFTGAWSYNLESICKCTKECN
jgi:cytochrome c oxidase subunit 2